MEIKITITEKTKTSENLVMYNFSDMP